MIDVSKISRFAIIQGENGQPANTYILFNDGSEPIYKEFEESDAEVFSNYLGQNGLNPDDPTVVEQAEQSGLFELYEYDDPTISDLNDDYETAYNTFHNNEDEVPEISDETNENRPWSKKKKAAVAGAAVVGAGALAGGIAAVVHSQNNQRVDETDKTYANGFEELMSKFSDDNPRKVFALSVLDTVKELNMLTSKSDDAIYKTENGVNEYAFSLANDYSTNDETGAKTDEYLQFTYDEVAAAKIVLNNYNSDQLFSIFGTTEIDSQKIMNDYQNFASKMELYSMNAKVVSGISDLIENETNRNWFSEVEKSIIEFNKNVNQENADRVIRNFEYFYEYDINGTDNVDTNANSINSVKNIAYHMVMGYYNSNAASDDYTQYLTVGSEPSEYDAKFQNKGLASVAKGEKLLDLLDRTDSKGCNINLVKNHITTCLEKLFYVQVSQKYNNNYSDELPSYDQIKVEADKVLGPYAKLNVSVIMANRQRGKTLELSLENNDGYQQWNDMNHEEQVSHAKENGEVVEQYTTTTEEPVKEENLTPEEKVEVSEQIEEIEDSITAENAYARGAVDANSYANESGAYNYSGRIINKVNPNAPEDITDRVNTLASIASAAYAFNGETISSSNSQIQQRLDSDVEEFKDEYSANDSAVSSYKDGWLAQIEAELQSAVEQGKITRKNAENAYKKAIAVVEESNKVSEITTDNVEDTKVADKVPTKEVPKNTTEVEQSSTVDPNQYNGTSEDVFVDVTGNDVVVFPNGSYVASEDVPVENAGVAVFSNDSYYDDLAQAIIDESYTSSEEIPTEEVSKKK